jgi:hypothetical protein
MSFFCYTFPVIDIFCFVYTSVTICDPKGFHPGEAYEVSCVRISMYHLDWTEIIIKEGTDTLWTIM